MSTKRKIAVSGVFLLALVGLAASTTRMVITIHLVTRGRAINDEDAYQSNTSWAFYIILEAGLTIIAVNLPTLWYYVAGVTPERVLRSVRSIISLGSDRGSQSSVKGSNVSEYQVTKERYTGGRSLDTGSSRTNLTNPDKRSVETYAMPDLEPKLSVQPTEGIRVDRSFQRTEEQV
ncbi:MAG: hypothetical protein M1818_002498 [Claussenomyces sp. TS43310]|nr:MAG: hypothetical protein M1818_002498 [Claussenomyces sp. TS43310]